jgi:hypothetical protein
LGTFHAEKAAGSFSGSGIGQLQSGWTCLPVNVLIVVKKLPGLELIPAAKNKNEGKGCSEKKDKNANPVRSGMADQALQIELNPV